jgi:hypothetical protein
MDPLLWAAVVITGLIILLPCAFRLGFEIGKQEALDPLEETSHSRAVPSRTIQIAMVFE